MSTPDRDQLVAEAEKVNAERTPGPWSQDGLYWLLRYADKNMDPDSFDGGVVPTNRETDAAFIAFCGTHMGTLLSLLASEGEKVKALQANLDEAIAEVGDSHAETAQAEADRDRLTAEVERLKEVCPHFWCQSCDAEAQRSDEDGCCLSCGASLVAPKRYLDILKNLVIPSWKAEAQTHQERAEKAEAEVTRLTARLTRVKQVAAKVLHCSHGCCSPCPHTRLVSDLKAELEAQR